MKRSELTKTIVEVVEENGVADGETAEELASDLADKLEEEYGLIDEDDEEDEDEEEDD